MDGTSDAINREVTHLAANQGLNLIGGYLVDGKKVMECLFYRDKTPQDVRFIFRNMTCE